MSTSNSGKSFEEQLREKLQGHEYEYHPKQWAKMQQKLHGHMHAASAAKTAVLKKTLYSAGKITGGLISVGAVIYTVLSLAGVVDRTDLGLGKETENVIVMNEHSPAGQLFNEVGKGDEFAFDTEAHTSVQNLIVNRNAPDLANAGPANTGVHADKVDPDFREQDIPVGLTPDAADQIPASKEDRDDQLNGQVNNITHVNVKDRAQYVNEETDEGTTEIKEDDSEPETEGPANKDSSADSPVNPLAPDNGKYTDKEQVKPFRPQFGLTGGTSIAPVKSNSADAASGIAFNLNMIGAFIAVPVNSRFTIQSGIQFRNQHNWDFQQSTSQVYYSLVQDSTLTEYTIGSGQYIDMPLTVKYNLTSKIHLYGGVKVNWLQSTRGTMSQVSYQNGEYKGHDNQEMYAKPQGFRRVDMDAALGLEYRFTKLFSLGAAYHSGLQDIQVIPNNNVSGPVRNSYLQLYAAMRVY